MNGLFIAGTDTGVGKTEVGRALLSLWAAQGRRPRALKPVETGCAPDAPLDALALRAACGPPHDALPLDEVCPLRLHLPAAPLVAAEAQGAEVPFAGLVEAAARAGAAGGPLLVEAAGGLLVPLAREGNRVLTNLDLAARLGLPVLLVGRARLGTLNHCALSAEALRARGLRLEAIVLNRVAPDDSDPTVASNARWVAALTGARVLGPTPFEPDAAARPLALRAVLAALASV